MTFWIIYIINFSFLSVTILKFQQV